MAGRIRTIKPEILENATTAGLSSDAFRVFVGMITLADDYGNLRAEPAQLHGAIFWACDPRETLANILDTLASVSLITRYSHGRARLAHLTGWGEHQRVDRPGKPRVPGPDDAGSVADSEIRETLAKESRDPRETLAPDLRSTTTTTTNDLAADVAAANVSATATAPEPDKPARKPMPDHADRPDLDAAFAAYPRRVGKTQGHKRLASQIKTAADLAALKRAVANYAATVRDDGTDTKYVKHWSTFAGCWRDYLDETPRSEPVLPSLDTPGNRPASFEFLKPHEAWTRGGPGLSDEEKARIKAEYAAERAAQGRTP